jgi:nucleoside-diphosphate-sugar epimerase
MKVLITGGAGYIGSELINYLLEDGYEVRVLDNLMYEKTSLLRYSSHEKFTFIKADVRNKKILKEELDDCDVIIPLAALVGFPLCDDHPRDAEEINYEINDWIAQNKRDDQKVIYPCTNSGYGKSSDGVCTEESPLNPVSLYGVTKVKAEESFKNVENHITFRLATVYGPSSRMRADLLVNNFVWRSLKDRVIVLYECEFMRNYVHIHDVCRAFMYVLKNWEDCKNETYNVGNDKLNMNKLDLAQKISTYTPLEIIKAEFTSDPDVRDYEVSSQKIYDKGFECSFNLDDGIKQLLTTYSIIDSPWYGNY